MIRRGERKKDFQLFYSIISFRRRVELFKHVTKTTHNGENKKI